MAADIYALMVKLGLSRDIRIVGHDIGTTVAYPYAAAHPDDVVKLVLSEAPIPHPIIYTFPSLTPHGPGLWWFGLFAEKDGLAEELMAAYQRQGEAMSKREQTIKMAEANKAFSHFAW